MQVAGGLLLAGLISLGAYVRRLVKRAVIRRAVIDADVAAVKTALLGTQGAPEYGVTASAGLVQSIEALRAGIAQLEERLGHNGGSTVFDALGRLQAEHANLMRWAREHTEASNQGMDELATVLRDLGVSWEPPTGQRYAPPR